MARSISIVRAFKSGFVSMMVSGFLAGAAGLPVSDAAAAPDVDGAVDALISTPLNTFGDAFGAFGLVAAGLGGGLGDLVALVDDNEYTRVVLRGFFSTSIQRLALGISQMTSGAIEGLRNEDLAQFPETAKVYLESEDPMDRIDTLIAGVGSVYVGATDLVCGTALIFLRAAGVEKTAGQLSDHQAKIRDRYLGPIHGGM